VLARGTKELVPDIQNRSPLSADVIVAAKGA